MSTSVVVRSHSESDIANPHTFFHQPFSNAVQIAESLPSQLCLGLPFRWHIPQGTNMEMNIPWSQTLSGGPNELLFIVNLVNGQPYACSHECTQVTQFNGSCCQFCAGLSPKVMELQTMIMTYKPRTQRALLNTVQLHQALDDRSAELNQWKFKVIL